MKKLVKTYLYVCSMIEVRRIDPQYVVIPTWDSEELNKSTDIYCKMLKDAAKEYLWPMAAALAGIILFFQDKNNEYL